jgi:hypothetical protein
MKRTSIAVMLFAFSAMPVLADCGLTVKAEYTRPDVDDYTVSWTPVNGATRYTIQESFTSDFAVTQNQQAGTGASNLTFRHATTAPRVAYYRVVAEGVPDCISTASITIKANETLRKALQREIIPVAGSTYGRYGSHFKTSLQLIGTKGMSGRIVFHPAGKFLGDDLDPSIPYSIVENEQVLEWDDVVAAMGVTGVGSLDIVPDAASGYKVPQVRARVYNDTGNGTFGTYEEPIFPVDFNTAAGYNSRLSRSITIPSTDYRVNLGLRTFTDVLVFAMTTPADRSIVPQGKSVLVRGGTFMLVDVQEFSDLPLKPGDRIMIFAQTSAVEDPVLLFHTLTDNRTNDPSISIGASMFRADVSSFFIY